MTEWKSFWEQVEEEVKRLEPLLRDRKVISPQEERSADSQTDVVESA